MKKLLSMLAIGTLVTTSVPSANMIINTSFNQKINNIKNKNDINKYKLINRLINFNQPDYFGNKYNGFVYKQEQKIDINDNFISLAKIDDKTITIPNFQVSLDEGEHEVSLLLKSDFKNFYNLFNADENGFVHYKFWIKKNIKNNIQSYKFNLNQSINNINNFWIDKENNIYIYSNDKLFKVNVGTRNAIEITGYNGILSNDLKFDSENNVYFVSNNKVYKINSSTTNAIEIALTGYLTQIADLSVDNQNNLYFISTNNYGDWKDIYKVNHGTTNAIKINIIGFSTSDIFKINFDSKNNLYIISNKLFKVNYGTNNAIEITGYNGLVENISLDKNDNLYFITDKLYKVTIGTNVAKEINITNLSSGMYDLLIDSQNNLFIFSLNGFFKVNHGTNNAIKISGLTPKKPINNACIDNQGNIFVNQDSDKIYEINVGTTQATKITFNFIPNSTPSKPMPTGEIIVIVASSLLGLGILGFGGYFIYYDRKHHVVKKWWEKKKRR